MLYKEVVWQLCREGYPLIATDAEKQFESGKKFVPDKNTFLSALLRDLIRQANAEITQKT